MAKVQLEMGGKNPLIGFDDADLDVQPHMRIYREEIFGPVLSVLKVRDYGEAFAAAEDTPFGLSAGIVTTSLRHAGHFKRHSSRAW